MKIDINQDDLNSKLGWNQSFKLKYFQLEIEHSWNET